MNSENPNNSKDPEEISTNKSSQNKSLSDYKFGEIIGRGAFGTVYRALNIKNAHVVAIKRIELRKMKKEDIDSAELEIKLLKELNHENIVQYVETIKSDTHFNVILDFVENGSLVNIMNKFGGKFQESLVAIYIHQVLTGLSYLHNEGVVHRDIKAANILATKDGILKLTDFGVAAHLTEDDGNEAAVGSPYWMAPEIIEMSQQISFACDIWSVGCTTIELLTGKPPYFDLSPMAALFHIVQDKHPPIPAGVSLALRDLLIQCFEKDPNKRISANDLLEHSWIKKHIAEDKKKIRKSNISKDIVASKNSLSFSSEMISVDINKDKKEEREKKATNTVRSNNDTIKLVSESSSSYSKDKEFDLAKYKDSSDDEYEFGIEGVNINEISLNDRKNATPEKTGSKGNDDSESDTFSSIGFDELDIRSNKKDKIKGEILSLIRNLNYVDKSDTLIKSSERLLELMENNLPEVIQIIAAHGLIAIMEMMESSDEEVLYITFRVVKKLIFGDAKILQNLCMLGFIPATYRLVHWKYSMKIRREAAKFIKKFCLYDPCSHFFTRKMFIACGGLSALVKLLNGNYEHSKELMAVGVDCVFLIFDTPNNHKNDFSKLFTKFGILKPLILFFKNTLQDKNWKFADQYSRKIANIFYILSLADYSVKNAIASPKILTYLLYLIEGLHSDIMLYILKCFRNLSMNSNTIDALEKCNAIPILIPFLSYSFIEIQNQVIQIMYNLLKICPARIESAALNGIVPHLMNIINTNHPLKEFVYSIICKLAFSGSRARSVLKRYDGINFYLNMLSQQHWQMFALDALVNWLSFEDSLIEKIILQNSNAIKIFTIFKYTEKNNLNSILQSIIRMITISRKSCRYFRDSPLFIHMLYNRLKTSSTAHQQNYLLKILNILFNSQKGESKESLKLFIKKFEEPVKELSLKDKVIVSEFAKKLLNDFERCLSE